MSFMIVFFMFITGAVTLGVDATETFAENLEAAAASVDEACPRDLSGLHDEMEHVLKSVRSEPFKKTIRASLEASIPKAIEQSDGITRQLRFIKKRILDQQRAKAYGENVARKAGNNMNDELVACQLGEKGSYCEAVEQYYIAVSSNIANQGFLDALVCYQRQGVH